MAPASINMTGYQVVTSMILTPSSYVKEISSPDSDIGDVYLEVSLDNLTQNICRDRELYLHRVPGAFHRRPVDHRPV